MSGHGCILCLEREGLTLGRTKMSYEEQEMIECPEHGGGFDCTPFCKTCGGEQGYYPFTATITVSKVDTQLLRFQRNLLLDLIGNVNSLPDFSEINSENHGGYYTEELLSGLVEMLDLMLDVNED